ncbi:MmgE/PrpD family protein [Streptomyces sp. NBC_01235]|uniref:MmgE/PrpD family protein n=1 Tax=Streptomyces sp. NBC_01235 TaxID=2903788 RepID=UPI002E1655F5|nr:MmgE/PrpD family protein [Streptomyces sp. NBC_01235]
MWPDGKNFGEALNDWMDGVSGILDVPEALVEDSAAASADFLLCALISRVQAGEGGRRADHGTDADGTAGAPIWWTGKTATAERAASANLVAGIAADFDSVHYLAGGHLAAFLTPSLFDRPGVSVDDTLRIQAVATEFGVRLGQAVKDQVRANAFHVTPIIGGLSAVYALARRSGFPVERIRWCLRLYLSTYRSDYELLGSDGRMYQMGQAMRQAHGVVAEGGVHSKVDRRAANEWWQPFSVMGVPMNTPPKKSEQWLSRSGTTTLKSAPCCAYFFETLAAVADLRRRVLGGTLRQLHVHIPRYALAAHRGSAGVTWLDPFDLVHNIAICWVLGRDSWTPLAELPTDVVKRAAKLITLHEVSDRTPAAVTAVMSDGVVAGSAETIHKQNGRGRTYPALQRKAEIVSGHLNGERRRLEAADDPRRLLRRLLDVCGEDVDEQTGGARVTVGGLQ